MKFAIQALLLAFLFGAGLGGCNTVEGFGEDLEEAGDNLEDEAEEAQ